MNLDMLYKPNLVQLCLILCGYQTRQMEVELQEGKKIVLEYIYFLAFLLKLLLQELNMLVSKGIDLLQGCYIYNAIS